MTKCINREMRDLLPDFMHGKLDGALADEVREHVVSCAECAEELELLSQVVAAAPLTPAMNIEQISAAIPVPTRQGLLLHRGGAGKAEPDVALALAPASASRRIWSRPTVRIAAALAIVTAGGISLLLGRDVLRPEVQVGQRGVVATPTQVATTPAQPVPLAPAPVAAPATAPARAEPAVVATTAGLTLGGELQDLSDEHLATLLNEIEQMDVLPGAEPEALDAGIGSVDSAGGVDQ